jgi:hypothetical protein
MSTEIETRAKELGWAPKEEFRGDPDKWIDAETYVKRGEELMPLLKANNRRQAEELAAVKKQLSETNELLKASAESIEALKEFNTQVTRDKAKETADGLKAALVEAKKEGDVDLEVELTEQLQEHKAAMKAAEKAPAAKPNGKTPETPTADYKANPEWIEWTAANPWFGKDKRRTALALGIGDELKSNPETAGLTGRALLDKVTEEVEAVFGGGSRRLPDKVEGGGPGHRGSSGKSFGDLPPDAKDACERQAARLVGEGRAFKTTQEWRNHYAKSYFAEE